MTDKKLNQTRRKILSSLGAIGVGAAATSAGTTALFNDQEEVTDNVTTAGQLDLKIGWEMTYSGDETHTKSQQLTSDPDPIFQIPLHGDVKPCDHGEGTITLHVYDNPAWIHMGGELNANDDNGLTDPERDAGDTTGGDGEGELAEDIFARVWYDDGDNKYDPGTEPVIASGSLKDVLGDLENGILLDANPMEKGESTGACTRLGKYDATPEKGETYTQGDGEEDDDFAAGSVTITDVYLEDGEVVGIDWESDVDICQVSLAGGGETVTHTYDCERDGASFAPTREHRQRNWYEISHVTFYYCDGADDTDPECFENSTDYHLGFKWLLPCSTGNRVQSDSVEFDLKFHAQQCRHVDDPGNPFADN